MAFRICGERHRELKGKGKECNKPTQRTLKKIWHLLETASLSVNVANTCNVKINQ